MVKKILILGLIAASCMLMSCGQTQAEVETVEPFVEQASTEFKGYTIHQMGQFTKFVDNGDTCEVHPYYLSDRKVTVQVIDLSQNLIWLELVKSMGYTLNDVTFYENGIQELITPNTTFAMLPISSEQMILATTSDLLPGYARLVLSHIE